eukprot:jgi/Tetstr1/426609/TSEL_016886.t1
MTGLGHHTVEVCNKILKRIWAELETTDEQTAISNLMAWLNCCQIETELLEAEEQLDEISQQYLLTYRNKLNGRNYLGSAARGPAHATSAPSSPARAVNASVDWLGPLDDSSSRLLRSTIVPETSPSWRDKLDSPQFKEVMDKLYSWDDFNIFTLTELTDGHPLEVVATQIINDLDLPKQLNLDMGKFRNFVQAVELTYRAENSYHNNIHAADVTQSLAVLLSYEEMRSQLTPMEHLAMVLAAVTHDIGHPGLNNDFLVNSKSEEAKIYHDQSVNENMHLRYAFKLLEKPDTNFIANLNSKDYWFLRQALIKLVLSTDMAVHPRLLAEFENHIAMLGPDLSKWGHSDRMCALAMFVHCADIANPAKPGPFARAWTFRVMEEFYSQGDKEKELNIPQSPGCIRGMVNVPKSQMTFLKYCVRPSYEALAHLFPEVFIAKNVDVAAEIQDKLLQQYGVSTFNNDISGNLKNSSFAEEAISIAVACNEGLLDCEGKALSDQLIPERELLKEWQETSNDTARFDI